MNHNEEDPDFLGGHGDMLPADVLKKVNELLEQLHQKDKDHQGSKIEIVYVASGGQHVENQYNGPLPSPFPSEARLPVAFPRRRGDSHADEGVPLPEWRGESHAEEPQLPEAAVMAKAVEATVAEGLWATNTCWSVVYMVYRMRGYNGGVSDFVREVDTWPFKTAYRLQLQPGLGGQAHQRGTNVNASGTMAGQWCATHFLPTGRGTDRGDRPQIRERNLPKNIPMCHKMMRRRGRLLSAPFSCRNFALDKSADVNNKTISNNSYSLKNKKVLWQN